MEEHILRRVEGIHVPAYEQVTGKAVWRLTMNSRSNRAISNEYKK